MLKQYYNVAYVDNRLCGGVGENEKVEGVIVVVDEGSMDALHQELGTTWYFVGSKVRAVDESVTTISTAC